MCSAINISIHEAIVIDDVMNHHIKLLSAKGSIVCVSL